MKKIVFIIFVVTAICYSQEKNKIVTDEKSGKPILLGICDREAFADSNFAWWYNSEYDGYEFNKSTVDSISTRMDNVSITIVMGTWCSDSRREVPRFFRMLDEMKYDFNNLTLICVDRKKECPEGNVTELGIEFVPTFIVYKNKEEFGRIIETPKNTLELDLKQILFK